MTRKVRGQIAWTRAQLAANEGTPGERYWTAALARQRRRLLACSREERAALRPTQRVGHRPTCSPRPRSPRRHRSRTANRAGPTGDPDLADPARPG